MISGRNPSLVPLLSLNKPILADCDCLSSELDDIIPLNIDSIISIAKSKKISKNSLSDIKDYVKLTESMYYYLTQPCRKTQAAIKFEPAMNDDFDINKPIRFSEL